MAEILPKLVPESTTNEALGYSFIGQGGEHLIFSEPGDSGGAAHGAVLKVNIGLLDAFNDEAIPERERYQRVQHFANQLNCRQAVLTQAFHHGYGRVVPQITLPRLITPDAEEVAYLSTRRCVSPQKQSRLWTIVTVQTRVPQLDPGHPQHHRLLPLDLPYAERRMSEPADLATYDKVQAYWLAEANGDRYYSDALDWFEAMQSNAGFLALVDSLHEQPVNVSVADFVTRAIAYSKQTGEVLDLAGESNVVFSRDGGYLLIDALTTKPRKRYAMLPDLLKKVAVNDLLSLPERKDLLNGIGYVRAMNYLACQLGLELEDQLPAMQAGSIPQDTWGRVFQYLVHRPDTEAVTIEDHGALTV
jgi:hypothetical protein